ncbi:PLP-dependent aminotransferase family protein [Undibacterium pigrum]|uniref:(S)-3,5-dihydroxyphenylglycine transaminase n=1 Tax=Undibacterium pigrum TaxID=401470 RepID=A0A318ILR1_9BURK|nr:PLP-dependent aminotransferase family protein [Undibacterium pigrum]PXX33693.1 (S)-3,5-dihydroxyphenylglycine transaminase [Undibacterium pigrum]
MGTGKNISSFSSLEVMNFLNEISSNFPKAVSFASGRPSERFFESSTWFDAISRFTAYFADKNNISVTRANSLLAQYGKTNGIISDLISKHLLADESIKCQPDQIIVTVGCQEAIELSVKSLCQDKNDVVIVRTPTYIGITGVCELNGIELASFKAEQNNTLDGLRASVDALERCGKTPRVLYLIPEFDNPTGDVLSEQERIEIIKFCASKGITILEDNPYGMYRFEGIANAPMFALDEYGCVIYLGTFSKTICPSLRVGFAVLPKKWFGCELQAKKFYNELSQRKSFITVNTSQISQGIVGGILLREECSLTNLVAPAVDFYKVNRDTMLECLENEFAGHKEKISWNTPSGGFFLSVYLPFKFKAEEALICAKDYGVLVMPLSFFALDDSDDRNVRLAFSYAEIGEIRQGIRQFSEFVLNHMQAMEHENDLSSTCEP